MKHGVPLMLILLLAVPGIALAQQAPIAPPRPPFADQRILIPFPGPTDPLHWNSNVTHPTHPWVGVANPNRVNFGTVVGYIEVPPQQVVVNVYVPGPGSFSGGFEPQLFEIPGYTVTETTNGYIVHQRVDLEQVTPGVLNWVTRPPFYQPK